MKGKLINIKKCGGNVDILIPSSTFKNVLEKYPYLEKINDVDILSGY